MYCSLIFGVVSVDRRASLSSSSMTSHSVCTEVNATGSVSSSSDASSPRLSARKYDKLS